MFTTLPLTQLPLLANISFNFDWTVFSTNLAPCFCIITLLHPLEIKPRKRKFTIWVPTQFPIISIGSIHSHPGSQTTFKKGNSGDLGDNSALPRHPPRRVEALRTSLDVAPASHGKCSEASLRSDGMQQVFWKEVTLLELCTNPWKAPGSMVKTG